MEKYQTQKTIRVIYQQRKGKWVTGREEAPNIVWGGMRERQQLLEGVGRAEEMPSTG
jgi:hypothetical protein